VQPEPPRDQPGPRPGGDVRLGGVAVRIRPSVLITLVVLFLLVFLELTGGRASTLTAAIVSAVTAVAFLASILAHELAHAVAARRLGYPVLDVTLFYLGGITRLGAETEDPRDELVTAIVGPLVNLLIAGILLVTAPVVGGIGAIVMTFLAELNAAIGVFNLLPAHPLDGGTLLRAGLTAMTGNRLKAIRISARAGQGLGAALVLTGVGIGFFESEASGFGVLWLAVIGMFILGSSRAGLLQADVRERLDGVRVGDLAAPLAWVGSNDWTVSMVVARMARSEGAGVIVDAHERPVGIFTPEALASLPTNLWEHLTLSEAMSGMLGSVDETTPVLTVMQRFGEDQDGVMAVTSRGMPIGWFTGAAILARLHAPRAADRPT